MIPFLVPADMVAQREQKRLSALYVEAAQQRAREYESIAQRSAWTAACEGCGAPSEHGASVCSYCKRQA